MILDEYLQLATHQAYTHIIIKVQIHTNFTDNAVYFPAYQLHKLNSILGVQNKRDFDLANKSKTLYIAKVLTKTLFEMEQTIYNEVTTVFKDRPLAKGCYSQRNEPDP